MADTNTTSSTKTFKSVTNEGPGLTFIRPSKLAEDGITGQILEGVFIEALANPMNPDKSDYKFELESGDLVVLNGTGSLAYKMSKVNVGDLVRVVYNGKEKIAKGPMKGKEAHSFDVLVAE